MHFSQLSKYQKRVSLSTGIGFVLERMDSVLIGLALASIIATLHISKAQGGLLPSITALGSLVGGVGFGVLADKFGRVKTSAGRFSSMRSELLGWVLLIHFSCYVSFGSSLASARVVNTVLH